MKKSIVKIKLFENEKYHPSVESAFKDLSDVINLEIDAKSIIGSTVSYNVTHYREAIAVKAEAIVNYKVLKQEV